MARAAAGWRPPTATRINVIVFTLGELKHFPSIGRNL